MHDYIRDILNLTPLVFLIVGLMIAVGLDSYIQAAQRRIMLLFLISETLLVAENYASYLLKPEEPLLFLLRVNAIVGYSLRPLLFVLLFRLVAPGRRFWWAWVLVALNALIYLTALFSGLAFSFHVKKGFVRGPLGLTCFYISALLFFYLIYLTVRESGRGRKRDLLLPFFGDLVIAAGVLYDISPAYRPTPASGLTVTLLCANVFYYIWLHLKFVRAHEQALIDGQRVQIMLSQIQPHFLYNSLGAIRDTYRSDTKRGERAITEFAEYLRHNMDSLTEEQPIPFSEELAHVRCYLDLQKLRFGDDLNVVYDLACTEFFLPTLTLQPLVENAVTYGVRRSETGRGTVTIRTRAYPDRREISVADDGPGFVPDSLPGDRERSHVGLRNVRERLKHTCGGELRIESVLGEGTTVTIILPIPSPVRRQVTAGQANGEPDSDKTV